MNDKKLPYFAPKITCTCERIENIQPGMIGNHSAIKFTAVDLDLGEILEELVSQFGVEAVINSIKD